MRHVRLAVVACICILLPSAGCCFKVIGEAIGQAVADAIGAAVHYMLCAPAPLVHATFSDLPNRHPDGRAFTIDLAGVALSGTSRPGRPETLTLDGHEVPVDEVRALWWAWYGPIINEVLGSTPLSGGTAGPSPDPPPSPVFFYVLNLDKVLLVAAESADPALRDRAAMLYWTIRAEGQIAFTAETAPGRTLHGTLRLDPAVTEWLDQILLP